MQKVNFVHMADGTAEDYRIIAAGVHAADDRMADDVLALLQNTEANDMGYQVDRLTHSLQSATLAHRDGQDEEIVIAALLHDVGDTLAPWNHAEVSAAILKPYVSEATHWIVGKHALFQTYYYNHHFGRDRNARDRFRGHPHYQQTIDFCEKYDQNAFDPNYDTMPLSAFAPMVRRLFDRPPNRDMAAHDT
ncbi:MAG: HD domain-containing protein [Alphaproteobacteria bacterium]|nr:HD domain-containing protein [Alphaproteobacteria bacterium]